MLLSVLVRRAATSALIGFGVWFVVTFFGGLITGLVGGFLAPISGSRRGDPPNNAFQETLNRLRPDILYSRGVAGAAQPAGDDVSTPATIGAYEQAPSGSRRSCRSTRASSSSGRRSSRSSP